MSLGTKMLKPVLLLTSTAKFLPLVPSYRSMSSLIDAKLKYFNSIAHGGWDNSSRGTQKGLHLINGYRLAFLKEQLASRGLINLENNEQPLSGLKILDVGCGAGIFSESLAMLGGEVTGIDPSEELIKAGVEHAAKNPKINGQMLKYLNMSVEDYVKSHNKKEFDVVILFYVLEHVKNSRHVVQNCDHLLKSNGSLLLGTANRTLANLVNYAWHQNVSKLLDKRLIKFKEFPVTDHVIKIVEEETSCRLTDRMGVVFSIFDNGCRPINSDQFNNILHFVKQ